jgi:hypothetical protein
MRIYAMLLTILFLTVTVLCQSDASNKPPSVPDEKAAIARAEAVLIPVYGKKHIESERPFAATLKDDVWTVAGTLYCPDGKGGVTRVCDGGVAVVKIAKHDGRILSMMHRK